MRTCTGCRITAPQSELVRLAFDGPRLAIDPTSRVHDATHSERVHRGPRRIWGRGAYVHASAACVTAAGLAKSLRRQVRGTDVSRIVSEMSPTDDNWGGPLGDQPLQNARQNDPGLEGGDTVEMPPRIKAKAKDDRSEDARL
jgi:predicted RNA-binding protein YlxR (DUF448 family)